MGAKVDKAGPSSDTDGGKPGKKEKEENTKEKEVKEENGEKGVKEEKEKQLLDTTGAQNTGQGVKTTITPVTTLQNKTGPETPKGTSQTNSKEKGTTDEKKTSGTNTTKG